MEARRTSMKATRGRVTTKPYPACEWAPNLASAIAQSINETEDEIGDVASATWPVLNRVQDFVIEGFKGSDREAADVVRGRHRRAVHERVTIPGASVAD